MTAQLNEANPITKFKRANPSWTWADVGKAIGVGVVMAIRYGKLDLAGLKELKLRQYIEAKKNLRVDLISDYGESPLSKYVQANPNEHESSGEGNNKGE